ncbi:hypothetical protein NX029_26205 [Cytobacillus firmus]|nr:hypothetical protein [Cytobacillus firmus]
MRRLVVFEVGNTVYTQDVTEVAGIEVLSDEKLLEASNLFIVLNTLKGSESVVIDGAEFDPREVTNIYIHTREA